MWVKLNKDVKYKGPEIIGMCHATPMKFNNGLLVGTTFIKLNQPLEKLTDASVKRSGFFNASISKNVHW